MEDVEEGFQVSIMEAGGTENVAARRFGRKRAMRVLHPKAG